MKILIGLSKVVKIGPAQSLYLFFLIELDPICKAEWLHEKNTGDKSLISGSVTNRFGC